MFPVPTDKREQQKAAEKRAFIDACKGTKSTTVDMTKHLIRNLVHCLVKSRVFCMTQLEPKKTVADALRGTMGTDIRNTVMLAIDKAADNTKNKRILDKTTLASVEFELCELIRETMTRIFEYAFTTISACDAFEKNTIDGDYGKPINAHMMGVHTKETFDHLDDLKDVSKEITDKVIAELLGLLVAPEARGSAEPPKPPQQPPSKDKLKGDLSNLMDNLI